MPILKQYRQHYGAAWRRIRRQILERAGHCCERCGKPDRATVYVLSRGVWYDEALQRWRAPGDACVLLAPPEERGVTVLNGLSIDLKDEMAYAPGVVRDVRRLFVVVCVAHLNHTPGDDRPDNLAAWCQYCHLIYDLQQHHISRATRKDARRPLLALVAS